MMKIESYKVIMCDIDDTLVLWDLSEYPELESIDVDFAGYTTTLKPHFKNINLVEKLSRMGYQIVYWSQTGYDWAELIVRELGLEHTAAGYMTKPRYYIDDMSSPAWMGPRIWRDPVSGDAEVE